MTKQIRFEWEDLGITAVANLADDKNPDLCYEVWNSLPFQTIQAHACVTGGSMYSWVPMLSFADVPVKERIDRAPIGRVRYSQNTGNKVSIQYGPCNEDIYAAVLGEIVSEDIPKVQQVGRAAWDSFFFTKELLRVRISRCDELVEAPSGATSDEEISVVSLSHQLKEPPLEGESEEVRSLVRAITTETANITTSEPDELKRVRLGRNIGVGSYGQYFGVWEIVYGQLRDYSAYTLYPAARLARKNDMEIVQLSHFFREIDPPYTNFLGFCGLRTLQRFTQAFRQLLEEKKCTKEDFAHIIDALCMYTNLLTSWAYFYFPWGIGALFRFPDESAT